MSTPDTQGGNHWLPDSYPTCYHGHSLRPRNQVSLQVFLVSFNHVSEQQGHIFASAACIGLYKFSGWGDDLLMISRRQLTYLLTIQDLDEIISDHVLYRRESKSMSPVPHVGLNYVILAKSGNQHYSCKHSCNSCLVFLESNLISV